MKKSTEKRAKPHRQYVRNPDGTTYYENYVIYQRTYRKDRNKQQFYLDENVVNLSEEVFNQP
jgi:hypothetical protein